MNQLNLFDDDRPIKPRDWSVTTEERPRLSRQCRDILELLERGPVSNKVLSQLSLKYTSRISDLRAAGYKIECFARDRKTGEAWYRLID